MSFRSDVPIALEHETDWFPDHLLLVRLRDAGFAADRGRAILDDFVASGLDPALLSPTAFTDDGLIVSERALYPRAGARSLQFYVRDRHGRMQPLPIPLDDDLAPVVEMMRAGFRAPAAQFRADYAELGDVFLDRIVAPPGPRACWAAPSAPGIYRREHATLLIRSATTTLLVDPLSRHTTLPFLQGMPDARDPIDGVLISHSHTDHWNPLAILERAELDTPIVVPHVPRTSVLTPVDMAAELRALGFRALDPAWGDTVTIGDITVDILPFFGEQPTRDHALADPALRSFGNCYRVTTPELSALILIDAGTDPAGSMVEVAAASRARRGPVDVVLACLREFASPFFGGLSAYWAALPAGLLRTLLAHHRLGTLPSTTAGPAGIAAVCAAAGARHFLPYAHGFTAPFAPIADIGWYEGEPSEAAAVAALSHHLAALGASTTPLAWSIGDAATPSRTGLTITRTPLA